MSETKNICLRLSSLVIGYPQKEILPPLSATVRKGEIVSVIGHNGVGKSTLLRVLAGITAPLGGSVHFGNRNIRDIGRREFALLAGYVSTDQVNAPNMRIFDLVAAGRFSHTNWIGTLTPSDVNQIKGSIDLVGLTGLAERYISEVSDGERQRAMIARVLAQNTDILILDEPTSFLDIRNRNEVLHLLHRLSREEGKTIIVSTHDLQSALSESDRIWLLTAEGITEGAPEDLVLSGELAKMFVDAHVRFRKSDGTFFTFREERGTVAVEGTGLHAQWTVRAMRRLGFRITDNTESADFLVKCSNAGEWRLHRDGTMLIFNSVYDLAGFVNENC